ncbi:MAG: hypothetical protein A2085_06110 [Gemmatimonadetes bacterium GWC2_71_10]|nr:MAG: hypothetical protein A2085_06110 [Gemmatimonadetes bacterium GWC2_71_10]
MKQPLRAAALAAALALVCPAALAAQQPVPLPPGVPRPPDSLRAPLDSLAARAASVVTARADSVRPRSPISPTGAFLRSLVLPGWGQARLGRNVTGGMFVAFEGLAGAMVWKTYWQLDFARARGKFVKSHRQEREDWLVLLGFNHLMAATEAYVSAHLYDFPAALRMQRLPDGATGVGVVVPLR